ncbi:ABC transporter ATP-binding protein [Symbiobacterium thermophilum]|uniref:Peptide ABC transporter ATP-binding protein n=1 Tax=Symbiobacterium thermophilum TaxID=2734 RepID=A0A953LID7_SYMTR|nr:ABC transporter ATP-binding protein [Symbiobacterium thermophilum]MBY6277146.1 peptide ABC transporter ATP-binding protein [Symbiobacterium thermophilum]
MNNLLSIENLRTTFKTYAGDVQAVRDVSLTVREGECLAVVGESGSGKSVTMLSVMRLLANNARIEGRAIFQGVDLLSLPEREMRRIRGKDIAMVFQDPMTGLNPTLTVGLQLREGMMYHLGLSRAEADKRAVELLNLVGVPEPERRLKQYPHEFSGGMRQRVMIAIALACNPRLIIADEPTTALDVTIQAQILDLLKRLKKEFNTSIIMITHNLGVVAGMADRVVVMYGGRVAEVGTVEEIFEEPKHPYTWALLRAVPRLDRSARERRLEAIPGSPPNMLQPPPGCPFHPRCPYAMNVCAAEAPAMTPLSDEHRAACWLLHPDAPPVEFPQEVTEA